MQCSRHPDVETFVACAKCETPICGRCMVSTPVGMRCRACASQGASVDDANAGQYGRAALVAAIAALALGWMSELIFWLGAVYGYLVGEAVLRGGGRRRGTGMQVIAGIAALVGGVLWHIPGFGDGAPVLHPEALMALVRPFTLVAIGLGVFFAVVHVRHV